jgi:hypothetical protein
MADETTSSWADLLREAKGPLVEALRYKTVLLSEIRRDKSARRWHGKQVTVPIFLGPQQGTTMLSETGSGAVLGTPQVVSTEQAVINSATIGIAVSFHPQVMKQADGNENSWAEVLPTKMERSEDIFGRVINEQMVGGGTAAGTGALLAAFTAGTGPAAATTVGTSANFYQLYPTRVCTLAVRASGADISTSNGAARTIVSIDETAGTVTWDASVTVTTNDGIYIQGSYGNALQGLGGAVATTGTFETIAKGSVPAWQGTDVSPAAATDPTISIFDKAERRVMQRAGSQPEFYLADPAVIDKYSQGLTVQTRWAGEEGTLESGWTGVRYRNKLLVPEYDMPSGTAYGVDLSAMALYTLMDGPDWDDSTGSIFQRFSTRSLPVEAWLVWMLQLGFHRCNGLVKIGNLNRAA